MSQARAVGRVLVASVMEHDWSEPLPLIDVELRHSNLSTLPAASAFHGVVGCVYHTVHGNPLVPAPIASALEATHHRSVLTHLQALADLRLIAPALDAVGAPWLVVKGPVLAEHFYARPDLRTYTDLDVVVPGAALGRVLEALEEVGARVLDNNWELMRRLMSGEVHLELSHGTTLDLHWHLVNHAAAREAFRLDMPLLYGRAQHVVLADRDVPTLDPSDTLVYLALHACLSGADRLVWVKDIERVIPREPSKWSEVVERSRRAGATLVVASMLEAARDVLGAPVPRDVVDELAPSRSWLRLGAGVRRAFPIERSEGRRSPTRLIARATRRNAQESTAELARRARAALRRPAHRWPAGSNPDPTNPESTLYAAGDRADFLEAVAQRAHS
jgi:hypothetical protein